MVHAINDDDEQAIAVIREMNHSVLAEVNRLFTFLRVTPEESRLAMERIAQPAAFRSLDRREGTIASLALSASVADHVLASVGPTSIDRSAFTTMAGQRFLNLAAITCLGLHHNDWNDLVTKVIADFHPLAEHGKRFMDGRKPGAVGKTRLAVRQVLKRNPTANAAEVWAALKAKPPRSMTLHENRHGKYIEIATADGINTTEYRRFANIVSEEKRPKKQ